MSQDREARPATKIRHLLLLGIAAAAFFSSTFILNRAMSLQGGHWVWSAVLRYAFMFFYLIVGLLVLNRAATLRALGAAFLSHWVFWTLSGTTAFGVFYSLLCFSASYAPGWVVATTWQTTILATPLVLLLFGKRTPTRALALLAVIFAGIFLVNIDYASAASTREVLLGALPVLVAALAYPLGNQMVWEAQKTRGHRLLPEISDPLLDNAFHRILLLTLGSAPFWLLLLLVTAPPPPTPGQWINTAVVALCSGVIATGLFLHARHLAGNSYEISAIDATQSSEVLFSLWGEIMLLQGALPGAFGVTGIVLTMVGLTLYTTRRS